MYQIVRSRDRYHFENEWLSTYWHFSFDHYYDPNNMGFGPLRVFNDDTIQPGKGFPTHGHREMEIVTCVLDGELEHRDSTGGHGIIGAGEVQRMTAGTGIRHSEFNASKVNPVHLLQIWILPNMPDLKPAYEQKKFAAEAREGVLLPIVSGMNHDGALRIHQNVVFYVSTLRPGQELMFRTDKDRPAYFFLISGAARLGEEGVRSGDAVKIWDEAEVPIKAEKSSEILLIDLP